MSTSRHPAPETKVSTPSSEVKMYVSEEQFHTYVIDNKEIKIPYVKDTYGDKPLRDLVSKWCSQAAKKAPKFEVKEGNKLQTPVQSRIYKIPGDIGFELKATLEYKEWRLLAFLEHPKQSSEEILADAETLAMLFVKNDRARAEIMKIPGFLAEFKKSIAAQQSLATSEGGFTEEYKQKIATYDQLVEHSYAYEHGRNLKRQDLGWEIEIQHHFYFMLKKNKAAAAKILTGLFQNIDLQEQAKKVIIEDTYAETKESGVRRQIVKHSKRIQLQNFLVAYDHWQAIYNNTGATNWTQCNLCVVPAPVFGSEALRLFDSTDEHTRADMRADNSNRHHRDVTGPLLTKKDGEIMGKRILWMLHHLDNIFNGLAVPPVSEETLEKMEWPDKLPVELMQTFRVQPSVRTPKSKELADMDPVSVIRLLADDENIRNCIIAFVEDKLKQPGIAGNKELEAFYLNKAAELISENYRPFLTELNWKHYLQQHFHNTLVCDAALSHYKGQAVMKKQIELIKDLRGANPPEIIFIIDRSGSMSSLIAEVIKSINAIFVNFGERNIDVDFRFVWFDSEAGWLNEGNAFRSTDSEAMAKLPTFLKDESEKGSLKPRFGTSMMLGFETALRGLHRNRRTQLILLTDGLANDYRLEEYKERAETAYQTHVIGKDIAPTDVSAIALHIVPELFAQADGFLQKLVAPFALRNPTARNVTMPVRADIMEDQVATLFSGTAGDVYNVVGTTSSGEKIVLGRVTTNQPVATYSAITLAEAAQGKKIKQKIGDIEIELTIPAGVQIQEMSLEESKKFEVYLLLHELEARSPGILFSTESKITKASQLLIAKVAQQYANELPWGAQYIAEYFLLGATPSTKAMIECGLIDVRQEITSGGGDRARYRYATAFGTVVPDAPVDDGAVELLDEERYRTFTAQLGQTAASQTCSKEKKTVEHQPIEQAVSLAVELVDKKMEKEEKTRSVSEQKEKTHPKMKSILESLARIRSRVKEVAKEETAAAEEILGQLRTLRDEGSRDRTLLLETLQREAAEKQSAYDKELKSHGRYQRLANQLIAARSEAHTQHWRQTQELNTKLQKNLRDKQTIISKRQAAYQTEIQAITKQFNESKEMQTLKGAKEKLEREYKSALASINKEIESVKAANKFDKTIYLSRDQLKKELFTFISGHWNELNSATVYVPGLGYAPDFVKRVLSSDEKDFEHVSQGVRKSFEQPRSVWSAEKKLTIYQPSPDLKRYNEFMQMIKDVYAGKLKFMEDSPQLIDLIKKRDSLENPDSEFNKQLNAVEEQLNTLRSSCFKNIRKLYMMMHFVNDTYNNEEIKPLQEKIKKIKDRLTAELVTPIEKKMQSVCYRLEHKHHLGHVEAAIAAINALPIGSVGYSEKDKYLAYYNDTAMPAHEDALVKAANEADRCEADIQEINDILLKAVNKGCLRDDEVFRLLERVRVYDAYARDELETDLGLEKQLVEFIAAIKLQRLPVAMRFLLTEPTTEFLEEMQQEMTEIQNYKEQTPALRVFAKEHFAILRVIRNGAIEAETWLTKPEEIAEVLKGENEEKLIPELLAKQTHTRGMESKINALINGKKLEAMPDNIVKLASPRTASAPSVVEMKNAEASASAAPKPAEKLSSIPPVAGVQMFQPSVTLASGMQIDRPRYRGMFRII